jgi:hypothetical protein
LTVDRAPFVFGARPHALVFVGKSTLAEANGDPPLRSDLADPDHVLFPLSLAGHDLYIARCRTGLPTQAAPPHEE